MISSIYAWIYLPGQMTPVVAGRLDYDDSAGAELYSFIYGPSYLRRRDAAIPLDPERLPLLERERFDSSDLYGALGVFRDASPDDWGRRIIEKKLGVVEASEFRYLIEAGDDRVGALAFSESATSKPTTLPIPQRTDLEALLRAADAIERGEAPDPEIASLLQHGTSMGGARPKATIRVDGELWLAKFPSRTDRLEIAAIEYGCLILAKNCGIEIPDIKLITVGERRVLLTRRFDRAQARSGQLTRCHFMSGLTLLGLHEKEWTKGSYPNLADGIRKLVKDFPRDGEELFRRMIFNMLVSNDDDHLRNHATILDSGGWRLSPAYDLVPHPQQSFTRQLGLGIGAKGRIASYENAMSESARFGLKPQRAQQIALEVLSGVKEWEWTMRESGVTTADLDAIRSALLPDSVVSGFPKTDANAVPAGSAKPSRVEQANDDEVARQLRAVYEDFESAAMIIEQAGVEGEEAFERLASLERARERLEPLQVPPMPVKPEGTRYLKLELLHATPELIESLGASSETWAELGTRLREVEKSGERLGVQSRGARAILSELKKKAVTESQINLVRRALAKLDALEATIGHLRHPHSQRPEQERRF